MTGKTWAGLLRFCALGLVLPAALERIRGVFGVKNVVPPPEAAGVVANKLLMVKVMMISTCPEGQEVVQAPWEFISTVGVNGLEQAQNDPDVHRQDMQITRHSTPQNGAADGAKTQDHDFDGRRIFRGQTKGRRVLVVDLVNGLVEGSPVQSTVGEVVPGILHHKEDGDLVCHGPEGGEGNRGGESAELSHGVEEPAFALGSIFSGGSIETLNLPDLGEFHGEMTQQDELGAVPLLLQRRHFALASVSEVYWAVSRETYPLNLVAIEQAPGIDKNPRQRPTEVNHFMHHERHDASRKDIVLHPGVPGSP